MDMTQTPASQDCRAVFADITDELAVTDVIDVHTHLRWETPQARSLAEVLTYHFIWRELHAAGMPLYVSAIKGERDQLRAALPYLPLVRFTSTGYCLRRILQDLYGMKEDWLTEDNLDRMIGVVAETAADMAWPREVLERRAHIRKSFLDIHQARHWAARMQQKDPVLQRYADLLVPASEDALFVTGSVRGIVKETSACTGIAVTDAASLAEAVRRYVTPEQLTLVTAFLGWASVDFLYCKPDPELVNTAIQKALRRERTTPEETNAVRVFAFVEFVKLLQAHGKPFQFFFGSESLHNYTSPPQCVYNPQTLRSLSSLFTDFPEMQFDFFIGSMLFSQEMHIMAKMHQNVHVAGIWWHNMYSEYLQRIIAERLDVCPLNKVSAFFSDAYMVEWSYAKWKLVQREWATVLADRVCKGYFSRSDASSIIKQWAWTNPVRLYGLAGA